MKKIAIGTIMTIAVVAFAFPAFAAVGSGLHGKGAGPHAGGTKRTAAAKPICDGTGPKGPGTGNQRPMDGRGKRYQGSTQPPQPASVRTEQASPPSN